MPSQNVRPKIHIAIKFVQQNPMPFSIALADCLSKFDFWVAYPKRFSVLNSEKSIDEIQSQIKIKLDELLK